MSSQIKKNKIQDKKNRKNKVFLNLYLLFFVVFLLGIGATVNVVNADPIEDMLNVINKVGVDSVPVSFSTPNPFYIKTYDTEVKKATDKVAADAKKIAGRRAMWNKILKKLLETGSNVLGKAILNTVNKIAYDTATWIGSGHEGQKPLFLTESLDTIWRNVADEAGGYFIEELGKEGIFGKKFNLCEPDFNVKLAIGLGLKNQIRPTGKPTCTWMEARKNWDEAMTGNDFLTKFQNMFDPQSNDLGIALSLQTKMAEDIAVPLDKINKELDLNKGWLEPRNIAGGLKGIPHVAESRQRLAEDAYSGNIGQWTGDALVDASTVFLNQLAITAFNKWMKSLAENKGPITKPYGGDFGGLGDYNISPINEGITGIGDRLSKMIEPNFTVRGDYNILNELTLCPDPTKAGPTNCVIDDKFSLAITERKTVGEALGAYLKKDGIFGFSNKGVEPNYNEGYPYRSMIILRKFRILPVGWEIAGQYIKDNSNDKNVVDNNTLEKMVACFANDDEYVGYYADWCKGLVDPNWVLKAPLNYCKREGPGSEILSAQIIGDGMSSQLSISRNDKYCADEQSCIKEKDDGSCDLFGYCTEERREWRFGTQAKACEPKYNTCQTFRGSSGETVSYLENTLNYGECNIDNVGCQAYCVDYDNVASKFTCTDITGNKVYLDKDVQTCKQNDEGCNKFIRLKTGLGVNLLTNSSFEEENFASSTWANDGAQINDGYDGIKALYVNNLDKKIKVGPSDYSVGGESFTLSFAAKACAVSDTFQLADQAVIKLNEGSNWQTYQTSYILPNNVAGGEVRIKINSTSCVIDDIKLERGNEATAYSDYGANGFIYQKYAPAYLNCDSANAPDKCNKYVTNCKAEDVNCELYTSIKDDISIPAQVKAKDYCPDVCVGYNSFIQKQTSFDSSREAFLIPATAKICSAEAIGCDEFTNLDELKKGGEAKEYYSALRQCIKPDKDQCVEFYSWEGSDKSGFQLRVVNLKKNGKNPAVIKSDDNICNQAIYKLPSTDPSYQPNCRQFYNRSGDISYHLINNTISCSDDCHPYRRTVGVDDSNVTCTNSGGIWDNQQNICVYMAIPDQGSVCLATQNGCREYVGNFGNNSRFVLNNDFEGSAQNWVGVDNNTKVAQSNVSAKVGENSLFVSGGNYGAIVVVGQTVSAGKSYVLSFSIKKTVADTRLSAIYLMNGLKNISSFTVPVLKNDTNWHSYKVNLINLDHEPSIDEKLVIVAFNNFYIDDVRLTEVIDHYYLIKDSWQTPDVCDRDLSGNISSQYMLGCDAYNDRDNNIHNLRSFSSLCKDSAVGCELMIDTKNSSNYKQENFNESDVASKITVPADDLKYVVYDKNKQCNVDDEGCQRLGKSYKYDSKTLYSEVYLKNKPDKYNEILCSSDVIGCQKWVAGDGDNYFKSPGDMVCEWRQAENKIIDSWGWYKKRVKHCGGVSTYSVCLTDKDCVGATCQLETSDNPCSISLSKTFGVGGASVSQPTDGWAGICPASESGCTEYIDPVSRFASNLVNPNVKDINLDPNTLYILKNGSVSCLPNDKIYELTNENKLIPAKNGGNVGLDAQSSSKRLYTAENKIYNCVTSGVGVELRRAVVGYKLKQNINSDGCDGGVNFEKGCVLFNERSQNGKNLANLTFNTDLTQDDGSGVVAKGDSNNNANRLIKVSPDRVCDKWLACEDIAQVENVDGVVCNAVGVCNKFNDKGGCDIFIKNTIKQNQTFSSNVDVNKISNMSGYAKVGYENSKVSVYPNNYYSLGEISATGTTANVVNGQFESVLYKNTHTTDTSGVVSVIANTEDPNWPTDWDCGIKDKDVAGDCEIIDDPVESQAEKICFKKDINGSDFVYAPEGKNYVRLISDMSAISTLTSSKSISVKSGEKYLLTSYVNTEKMSKGAAKIKIEEYKIKDGAIVITIATTTIVTIATTTIATTTVITTTITTTPPTRTIITRATSTTPAITTAVATPRIIATTTAAVVTKVPAIIEVLNTATEVLSVGTSTPWTFKVGNLLTLASDTKKIKIVLTASNDSVGSYYFDDVKIRPVLESAKYGTSKWYIPQTCRLYPKDDSMSCSYNDDSGLRYKGWYGYCLEYDRYPGDPNVCLLWWNVPPETSRVNEWCGDGKINGEEECDCGSNKATCDSISAKISAGVSVLDQYTCDNCHWNGGWCGDGNVQIKNKERCDWNKMDVNNPTLNNQSCWNNNNIAENTEYSHDGYSDFLHGSLGCNNNDVLNRKCIFNVNGCSDWLVNDKHKRKQCIDAGGVVWAHAGPEDKKGWQVTDGNGKITTANVGNMVIIDGSEMPISYFCKFNKGICAQGWTQYDSWSTTSSGSCIGTNDNASAGDDKWKDKKCGEEGSTSGRNGKNAWVKGTINSFHSFLNTGVESCFVKYQWDMANEGTGKNVYAECTATANITSIGCY